MKFRTVFQPTPSAVKLSINRPILFCGSCFSDYICSRLKRSLWSGENMGGTLFNPISISYAIKILLLEDNEAQLLRMIKDSLIQHDGVWHSLLFDSSCSDTDKNKVIEKILLRRRKAQSLLEYNADMIITFGTAWTYAMIEAGTAMEGKIVGNCHKLPAHLFERRLLDPSEIIEEWYEVISELKARRPDMHFIFTLSPVRHIKDGLAGNSFSKSILRVSIENLIKEFSEEYPDSFDYFPAYEIVNDDLRDYRFYQSDLLHPNDQAVDYIWEKFTETYLNVEQSKLLAEGENILKGLNHRPLIERHEIERERMQSLRNKYKELQKKWHEVSNIEFSAYGI